MLPAVTQSATSDMTAPTAIITAFFQMIPNTVTARNAAVLTPTNAHTAIRFLLIIPPFARHLDSSTSLGMTNKTLNTVRCHVERSRNISFFPRTTVMLSVA